MNTIRRSQVVRTWNGHCRVGDIVNVLATRENVRHVADALKTPYDDFNGEAFSIHAGPMDASPNADERAARLSSVCLRAEIVNQRGLAVIHYE
jgi:hypothetical protein